MARIKMDEIVEALDVNFERVLTAVVADVAPEVKIDPKMLMRVFRNRLERGFGHWESVPERCVDTGW